MLLITIILLELFLIIFKIYYLNLKKFCKVVQGLFYVLLAMAKPYKAYNTLR